MYRLASAAAAVLMPLLLSACGDSAQPTEPGVTGRAAALGGGQRGVSIMDACEPQSFNAALGEGSCLRKGGVGFEKFLSLLGKHQTIGSWHFAPSVLNVRVGQTLLAINKGGEVHTFTEVEEFGGGIVPLLNDLSGNPEPAPECLALEGDDFIPAGGTDADEVEEPGTELYECCIHPWMRTVVHARP